MDDPNATLAGRPETLRLNIWRMINRGRALGFPLSWTKGQRGPTMTGLAPSSAHGTRRVKVRPHEHVRIQCFVDDPIAALAGSAEARRLNIWRLLILGAVLVRSSPR